MAALLLLAACGAVAGLQVTSHAYEVEPLRHTDEAAHYLNGVVLADYLRSGWGEPPLAFAKSFYLHYPAIAPLVWPPLWHAMLALWMAVAGTTPGAALALAAVVGGGVLAAFFASARAHAGWAVAAAFTAILWGLPLFNDLTTCLMADLPLMLMAGLFTLAAARFLENPSRRNAWLLGLAGGLWGLTKPNGLAALPAMVLLLAFSGGVRGAWRRLAGAAALAAILSVPAAMISVRLLGVHHPGEGGLPAVGHRMYFYANNMRWQLGWPLLALALAGTAAVLIAMRRGRQPSADTAALAVLAGYLAFHVLLPFEHNERYLGSMLPLLLYFATTAVHSAASALPGGRRTAAGFALGVAAWFFFTRHALPPQSPAGFREAARALAGDAIRPARVLVVSEEKGETAFTAEMASLDPARRGFVVRGSKLISDSNWHGGEYKLLHADVESLATHVERLGIRYVVFDNSVLAEPRPEHTLAWRMLAGSGGRFKLERTIAYGRRLAVYRVTRAAEPPLERIEYRLSRSAGITVSE
ncbi:MAG: glycosyltransferase family 39 protein [Acidobacteria bacterium]|nr:glycosyltransferase family 39 protein [Acidobacteriota bacterium]